MPLPVSRNKLLSASGLLLAALIQLGARPAHAAEVRDLGSRLELFVDRYLIDDMSGTALKLNHPVDAGMAIDFNEPWEGPACNFVTMVQDGPLFRCYYRGKPRASLDGTGEVTCMAESRDGVHWTKPDLGLFGHNNQVIGEADPLIAQNFTPFVDTRPGVPAAERYKALGGLFGPPDSGHGYWGLVSPDGIHWRKIQEKPVIDRSNFPVKRVDDSGNPAFWWEPEKCYVAYIRAWAGPPSWRGKDYAGGGSVRAVGRLTSPDFIHWSQLKLMTYNGAPLEQLYNNATHPYFRAPHILISTPPRIVFDRPNVTLEEIAAIKVFEGQSHDSSEPVLMSSRGGYTYDRTFMEAFIRNYIGPRNWTSRDNYPAIGLLPTGPHEMSLYTVANYGQPTNHLERFALPFDRFASVNAPYAGGEFTTKPLTFAGRSLFLNFSSSVAGGIRIEIQDASGKPIPGFTLADSIELTGNAIERVAAWKSGATELHRSWKGDVSESGPTFNYTYWKGGDDIARLAGTPIRLRFVMKEADLYALRFR